MAGDINTVKIRRGTGNPGSNLSAYELGWDTSTNSLYIGNGVNSTLITNSFTDDVAIDPSTGDVTIYNNLTVNGNTTLGDAPADSTTIRGTVNISDTTKTTTVKGLFNVDEAASFDSSVTVTGVTYLNNNIDVNSGNLTIAAATGNTYIKGTLEVDGSLQFDGTSLFNDDVTLTKDLAVNGNTVLGNADTDSSTIRGTVTIADSTKVTNIKGTLNVDEAVTFDTTLGVTGNTTLGTGTTNVNTIYGTVNISNPAIRTTVKGLLNVDEEVTFDSTLDVTGITTLNNDVKIVGDIEIGAIGNPKVTIDSATGDIATAGTVNIGGNLVVQGTTTTVNSTVVTIKDPIFTLGEDTTQDFKDRGIEFKYNNGTDAKTGFFGYDDSTGRFTYIKDATNTSEVFSGTVSDIETAEIYQSQKNGLYSTVSGSAIVNASDRWNKISNAMAGSISSVAQYDILQADANGVFQPTSAPINLVIDCGTY